MMVYEEDDNFGILFFFRNKVINGGNEKDNKGKSLKPKLLAVQEKEKD